MVYGKCVWEVSIKDIKEYCLKDFKGTQVTFQVTTLPGIFGIGSNECFLDALPLSEICARTLGIL